MVFKAAVSLTKSRYIASDNFNREIRMKNSKYLLHVLLVLGMGISVATASDAVEVYAAVLTNPDRSADERSMDETRKPLELLPFIGIEPGMKALDIGAGGGYTTMLLARVVGENGQVFAQALSGRPTLSNITALPSSPLFQIRATAFDAGLVGSELDVITMFFTLHDMYLDKNIDKNRLYRDLYSMLKPGGVLVILDNNGVDGSGISLTRSTHRIDKQFVINELSATKFRLEEESMILRNNDDDPTRPWNRFSPQGFHDRFALKFRKPE
ncbi:MAG: putative methyltransferase [Lysobacterales bacterium]